MKKRFLLLFTITSILLGLLLYSHIQLKAVYTWGSNVEHDLLSDELTVVTYNIRYGKGLDGKVNLNPTIETLKNLDADIISLQEVERYSVRSLFSDQVTEIAKALQMNAFYYPSLSYPGLYYGNVILTKYPIAKTNAIIFENVGENRSAIVAKIKLPNDEQLYVVNTHLGLNKHERTQAIEKLYELIKVKEKPVLITGDLNSTPKMHEYKLWDSLLTKSNLGIPLQTFHEEDWQIDYIFHSPHFLVNDVKTIESIASDHYPVKAKLQIIDNGSFMSGY